VIAAVAQGSQIQCNVKQYPEVRAALTVAAEMKPDRQDEALPKLALNEIARLDLLFVNSTGHTEKGTFGPLAQAVDTTASGDESLSADRRDQKLAHTGASECEAGSVSNGK
jgi:hypothetical protein